MVKESMLSREEKQWLKVCFSPPLVRRRHPQLTVNGSQDHNQRCYDKLAPYLKDDKRAMKWLEREAKRGIGLASPGPGGMSIDWD